MAKRRSSPNHGQPKASDDNLAAKQIAEEPNAAAACTPGNKLEHADSPADQRDTSPKSDAEKAEEAALAAPTADFANGQQLAKAIAQQCDLVAVGSKLLRDGEAKGASVRARMFETTVEYLYGKPAAAAPAEAAKVVFLCDVPRPRRKKPRQ
jgi:hypothetical protein